MRVIKRDWIKIHFQQEDFGNVENIFSSISKNYPLISNNLGVKFSGELNIYLASGNSEFGELTGWRLPPWVQGVALPKENIIVLKSPRWSGSQVDLSKAAIHEFIHILIETDIGSLPRWMNEGLCVLMSGEIYFNESALSSAALSGKFLKFDQIENVMSFNTTNAALAYQQSLSATRYLVQQFGWNGIRRIISNLKHGDNFEDAFFNALGLQNWEFELEWEQKRGKPHRWMFLKDLNYYLGYVFGPLVLLTGGWLWFRRRRTLKRWRTEEWYDNYPDENYPDEENKSI